MCRDKQTTEAPVAQEVGGLKSWWFDFWLLQST